VWENPNYLEEFEELRAVIQKEHVNSSGKLQICDLLMLFHWIKNPQNWLKHLNAGVFRLYVEQMTAQIEEVLKSDAKFDSQKRKLLIEAMALLFNVILPRLSREMIIKQWVVRGTLPRPTWEGAFQQIPIELYPSASFLLVCKENEDAFIDCVIEEGWLTDKIMDTVLPPCIYSLDNAALRSMRTVILTLKQTRDRVMARRDTPRLLREQKAKEREEASKQKEKEKKVLHCIYIYSIKSRICDVLLGEGEGEGEETGREESCERDATSGTGCQETGEGEEKRARQAG
jgi:hypothetical protein